MLRKLSDEIRYAHERAAKLGEKAKEAATNQTRDDFLDLQRSWLRLARSYEFTERLKGFTKHAAANVERLRAPVPKVNCPRCRVSMRLMAIEPHPTQAHTDVRTYKCIACDALRAHVVPLD